MLEWLKKKKKREESVQWQSIQLCRDVWRGELLPLFLNSTVQRAFRAIKSHKIMGDDFCTEVLQCRSLGGCPWACFLVHLEGWELLFMHYCPGYPNLPTEAFISKKLGGLPPAWRAGYNPLVHFADPDTNKFLAFQRGWFLKSHPNPSCIFGFNQR